MALEQGCIQVYTGNGKGKTTAALGLALRAVGRGLTVCMFQFIKGGGNYGEHLAAEKLAPLLTIISEWQTGMGEYQGHYGRPAGRTGGACQGKNTFDLRKI